MKNQIEKKNGSNVNFLKRFLDEGRLEIIGRALDVLVRDLNEKGLCNLEFSFGLYTDEKGDERIYFECKESEDQPVKESPEVEKIKLGFAIE